MFSLCSHRRYRRLVCICLSLLCVIGSYVLLYRCLLTNPKFWQNGWSSESALETKLDDMLAEDVQEGLPAQKGQACVHPRLDLWHESISGFFQKVPELSCATNQNWVFTDNATFRISPEAIQRYGDIQCAYIPTKRGSNDFSVLSGASIENIKSGSPLPSDFFKVDCYSKDLPKNRYQNMHSGISPNSRTLTRRRENGTQKNSMDMNILMFGFDSVSKLSWIRHLPRSHDYIVNTLKGFVLDGYNIVGDGTPQALLPILTGKTEEELPEARRGRPGAGYVDGHPWIWKNLKKLGYVTQYGEDGCAIGTFQYRMLGFKEQPVDHYFRPFYLEAEKLYRHNKRFCLGSMPRHLNMMNWVKEFFTVYSRQLKFSFLYHTEFSHDSTNDLQIADKGLRSFLETLNDSGQLNNTILILMADHGARFRSLRSTVQGKIEERMPYMSFTFPPWFAKKYPTAVKNLRTNIHRLTTPFDIHATFLDIIDYKEHEKGDLSNRGISLFREVPKERTCKDAGVEPHWCTCVNWQKANIDSAEVVAAVNELIKTINGITSQHRDKCAEVRLGKISSAFKFEQNKDLMKFKKSSDFDGRAADLSDNMQATEILYQVTVHTDPGHGVFEATVKYDIKTKTYRASDREISRINKYGKHPHCVMTTFPHLRKFCYCKIQI